MLFINIITLISRFNLSSNVTSKQSVCGPDSGQLLWARSIYLVAILETNRISSMDLHSQLKDFLPMIQGGNTGRQWAYLFNPR